MRCGPRTIDLFLTCCLTWCLLESTGLAAPEKTLTLEESIRMAVTASTSVLKSTGDRELAGTQAVQSYLQFLPNVVAQAGYGYAKGTSFLTTAQPALVSASNYGPSYQLSTTLNLFNGLSDYATWQASTARRSAAERSLRRAKQQISLDVAQSFLQVALDNRLIEIARNNLQDSQERQHLLEEQTKVGVKSLSDLFRQQAQTSSDESFFVVNENKQKTDLILLLRRLRIDPAENYRVLEPPLEIRAGVAPQASSDDEAEMMRTALEHRLDYEASRLSFEATRWDVRTAKSTYFPRLDLVATYGASARSVDSGTVNGTGFAPFTQASVSDQLTNQTAVTYGVYLTWSLFDRGVTPLNVERAKNVSFKAELDYRDYRNQVIGEARQAYSGRLAARKQLEASAKGVSAARKAYEVSKGKYEVGALNFIDLATTQLLLLQAEAARAQALVEFELQRRSAVFALGVGGEGETF